jgi:succinylarginine dihydrolase
LTNEAEGVILIEVNRATHANEDKMSNQPIILDTPDGIAFARLATLKHMLKLETLGMKRRGRSAYAILKDLGYKGSREKVLAQVTADVETAITGGGMTVEQTNALTPGRG